MENNWYAVYVRSRHEWKVKEHLEAKGFEVFLPAIVKMRRWKDRQKNIAFPLFPGYLFVKIVDVKKHFFDAVKTPGVLKILGGESGIVPVPQEQIQYLHALIESRLALEEHPFLKEGQKVRIARGPLCGVSGILVRMDGAEKIVVCIDLIQRGVSVRINLCDVEPVMV